MHRWHPKNSHGYQKLPKVKGNSLLPCPCQNSRVHTVPQWSNTLQFRQCQSQGTIQRRWCSSSAVEPQLSTYLDMQVEEVWQESTTLKWVHIHDSAWKKSGKKQLGNNMKSLHRCIIMHYATREKAVLRRGEVDACGPFNPKLLPAECSNNSSAGSAHKKKQLIEFLRTMYFPCSGKGVPFGVCPFQIQTAAFQ